MWDALYNLYQWCIANQALLSTLAKILVGISTVAAIVARVALPRSPLWRFAFIFAVVLGVGLLGGATVLTLQSFDRRDRQGLSAYLQQARQEIDKGNLAQAQRMLDLLLGREPKNSDALVMRCEVNDRSGRYDAAAADCISVLTREADGTANIDAQLWLGQSRLGQQRAAEAIQLFQTVLNQDAGNIKAKSGICVGQYILGEYTNAVTLCSDLLSKSAELRIPLDQEDLIRARLTRCAAAVDSHLETSTNDAGNDSVEITQDIANDCEHTASQSSSPAVGLMRVCLTRLSIGQNDLSQTDVAVCDQMAMARSREQRMDVRVLAGLYGVECMRWRMTGAPRLDRARDACLTAVNLVSRRSPFALKETCFVEILFRSFSNAIHDCTDALKLRPSLRDAYYFRCLALFWSGDLGSAERDCREAVTSRRTQLQARRSLCRVLFWRGSYVEAAKECADAIEAGLQRISRQDALAYLCHTKINLRQPTNHCDLALSLRVGAGEAFANLGRCILARQQGDAERAVEACSQSIIGFEACRHYSLGANGEAFSWEWDACPSDPWAAKMHADAYANRAELNFERGDCAQAHGDLIKAIGFDASNSIVQRLRVQTPLPGGCARLTSNS